MARSQFKGPFINPTILLQKEKKIKLFPKNSIILPEYVGYMINIYTGKKFILIKITEPMVGYRFGEFIFTRANYKFKKTKKKK